MFEFILVAQALGIINQYFREEASDEDFWAVPIEVYQKLANEEKRVWLMIDPQKLKEQYRKSAEILILTIEEKNSLLKAFTLLRHYSQTLSENAHLYERLLLAKNMLPPVFFDLKPNNEECKIIPFNL